MKPLNQSLTTAVAAACVVLCAASAQAQDAALKGKTVAFVPTSLGYDLTDGWYAMIRKQLEPLGVKVIVRDPNWSTDAGAQAITSLISEKPDVLLVQNPDIQSYARLLKRAEDAGIRVVQVNMRSSANTSAFVGADWIGIGEAMANAVVKQCTGPGKSGKISIVQGVLTAAASTYQMKGVQNVLAKNTNIKVVSNQAADWDATKARAVTDTTLKQNPDLCGIIGFWDGQDTGTAAAIREAKKQDQVFLVTNGGAASTGCTNVANGNFSAYMTYNVKQQSDELVGVIKTLLSKPGKPATEMSKVTPVGVIDKASLKPDSCWNLADYKTK